MNSPKISIVIPTRNRSTLLERLLRSIQKQSYRGIEVLVVDDSDPGGETSLPANLNGFRLRLLRTSTRGANNARNLGIQDAKGEIIYLLDDDTFLPDQNHILCLIHKFQQESRPLLLGGKYRTPWRSTVPQWTYNCSCNLWLEKGLQASHPILLGGNLAFRRQDLTKEVFFSPHVFNGGDEFGFHERFKAAHPNGCVQVDSSMAIFHDSQLSWSVLMANSRRQQTNNPTTWKAFRVWLQNLRSFPWLALPTLAYVVLGRISRS
jgi:glycosyltransferase involved in cell wall biosynthesis